MIDWQFFPKSKILSERLQRFLNAFELNENLVIGE